MNSSSNNNQYLKATCPDIPDDGCSICGPGLCVTHPNTIFSYPGQPEVECGVLEKAGHGGVIPLDQCAILPKLIKNDCKCHDGIPITPKPTSKPTHNPTHRPTPSPTRSIPSGSSACPDIPDDGCSICGSDKCVTDFDTIFSYPGQPEVGCGVLEKAGHGGVIPLDQCVILPKLIKDKCKCRSSIPATSKPTHRPTPSPTRAIPSGSSACPDIPDDGCSICGSGKCVTDFDTIFSYPGQPAVGCGVLEKAGHGGVIPLDQCAILPKLIKDNCKCRSSIPATSKPTHRPTPSPTRSKPSSLACPDIPDDGCSICGSGKCVTDFDTIFSYPGQPAVECGVLEKAGHGGVIPLDQCAILPKLIKDNCKCRSSISITPEPSPGPTRKPTTHKTTPKPTREPTTQEIEWPRVTYPPISVPVSTPISGALFAGPTRDSSSSDGVIIGLTIATCMVGIAVVGYAVYLLRKGKTNVKDASMVGIALEADGSSIIKSQAGKNKSKAMQDVLDQDLDLL